MPTQLQRIFIDVNTGMPTKVYKMQFIPLCTKFHIWTVLQTSTSRIMAYWGIEMYQRANECIIFYTWLQIFHNIDVGFPFGVLKRLISYWESPTNYILEFLYSSTALSMISLGYGLCDKESMCHSCVFIDQSCFYLLCWTFFSSVSPFLMFNLFTDEKLNSFI